jgi:hypothetical protein
MSTLPSHIDFEIEIKIGIIAMLGKGGEHLSHLYAVTKLLGD